MIFDRGCTAVPLGLQHVEILRISHFVDENVQGCHGMRSARSLRRIWWCLIRIYAAASCPLRPLSQVIREWQAEILAGSQAARTVYFLIKAKDMFRRPEEVGD